MQTLSLRVAHTNTHVVVVEQDADIRRREEIETKDELVPLYNDTPRSGPKPPASDHYIYSESPFNFMQN